MRVCVGRLVVVVAHNPDKNEANQLLDDAVGPMALQVTKNGG